MTNSAKPSHTQREITNWNVSCFVKVLESTRPWCESLAESLSMTHWALFRNVSPPSYVHAADASCCVLPLLLLLVLIGTSRHLSPLEVTHSCAYVSYSRLLDLQAGIRVSLSFYLSSSPSILVSYAYTSIWHMLDEVVHKTPTKLFAVSDDSCG